MNDCYYSVASRVTNPSQYALLGDSSRKDKVPDAFYLAIIDWDTLEGGNPGFYRRHRSDGNLLFFDGHVSTINRNLEALKASGHSSLVTDLGERQQF